MEQHYREERFLLEAEGAQLPAALTLPEGQEVKWSIVIIPGSMASDVDGNYPSANMKPHMYADLARQLAQHGHAVLRYAKIGSGSDAAVVDKVKAAEHRIFPQQQYIAVAACQKMREMVPHARGLALAGHSEGSVHGLVLAQQRDLHIDAFISLSGPAYRYIDLFIHMARKLSKEQGAIIDFGAFKVNAANYIRTFELLREGKPLTDEIKADPMMEFFVKNWDSDSPEAERSRSYMRDYDAIDPCAEIAKIPCPVLIVQGGLDQSGVISDNGEKLYQARYAARPDATDKAFFPELQHFYKRARPDMNSMESMMLDGETDERVSDAISAWLDRYA
ncbi:MAG TPA: alpha/beta fold hydrolase [Ktedonobacteraceae bacterium]|nr:alpha/beta fold hydrolase [Ktedonobacteraceae bacterium]